MSYETGEVRIIGADPERVVSVTVGELRGLCTDERDYGASDEDDSDIAIHERTCHMVDGYCDVCGRPDPSSGDAAFCAYCGARVVSA